MIFRLWGLSIKSQISYKKDFIVELIVWLLYSFIPFIALSLVLEKYGKIGNLSLGEIAVLYGLSQIAYDFARMVGRGFDSFSDLVMSGDFDLYYIRPLNIFYQILASELFLRRLSGIIQGVILVGFGVSRINQINGKIILFILIILGSAVVMYLSMFVFGAALTLITLRENIFLSFIFDLSSQTAYYPLQLLKNPIKFLLSFVLPIGICIYYPVIGIINGNNQFYRTGISCIVSASMMIVGVLLFNCAKRIYRSVNN